MLGGIPRVQPDEVPLPLHRLRGLVVQPDGGAEPAGALGGQGERVARRVSEPGGDLAVAGVESVLGEQVGLGDLAVTARQSVEDAAVGQGAARHGLDVPEVGAAEAESDGRVRTESVTRFQDDETAAGADQGGSGVQGFLQRAAERVRAGQAFGEFVQRREVRDPAREFVLQNGTGGAARSCGGRGRWGARGGGRGRDSVCGGGNRGIDSSHFRRVRGVHGVRLSDRCVLLKSIANPHVILRR
jgi:hypothetical protein